MKKIFVIIVFVAIGCQWIAAYTSVNDKIVEFPEAKCDSLQRKLVRMESDLCRLLDAQKNNERIIQALEEDNVRQRSDIDSLSVVCEQLENDLSENCKSLNDKIIDTENNVTTGEKMLRKRSLWGVVIAFVIFIITIAIAYILSRRIKSGSSTIDDVRKAQESLRTAQEKMPEESVRLDNQLLAVAQKQLEDTSSCKSSGEPDHSLVVKLADEIARIETNLSKMDKSVKGYKQLVQAKDRMINNVRANGYEIISLLGQDYNDGMQFQTRFVPDDTLPEGKRIITGMIKMQVNYNGKMIQPAQIVVSQNI